MEEVFIVAAQRSAMTKANKGALSNVRPDDLLAQVIQSTVAKSAVDVSDIADVVIGCAFPEAEQGLNIARVALLLAGLPDSIPGMTLNRYCASGLNAIAIAANLIQTGNAQVVLAGGVESMSMIPMGGNDFSVSPQIFATDSNVGIGYGMGLTAEKVAEQWHISRLAQDEFATASHTKAYKAQFDGMFVDEIVPVTININTPNLQTKQIESAKKVITADDGIRHETNVDVLSKLKPAFASAGSVTAGNSSQMTDGAACLVLVSASYMKKHRLTPLARFVCFSVAGVDPKIMGIGPVKAIPQALAHAKLSIDKIDWLELNEAFAAQSLAVIHELELPANIINPYGGAIALGHPLGATGAILSTKAIHAIRRHAKHNAMISMCIGTGMGAAGIFSAV